jgi:hypothetical protein
VDREAQPAQDQGEEKYEQDERHEVISFVVDDGLERSTATRVA